jgi:hypothetical protein
LRVLGDNFEDDTGAISDIENHPEYSGWPLNQQKRGRALSTASKTADIIPEWFFIQSTPGQTGFNRTKIKHG